ncbi:hypothetical protein GEMRC1_002620 [Eukaryota sp. GEM-RC1]
MASNHFGLMVARKLLNGTVFSRVVNGFLLQAKIEQNEEVRAAVRERGRPNVDMAKSLGLDFSEPFKLSLANSDVDDLIEEFFITIGAGAHLNGKHFIFGEVVDEESRKVLGKLQRDSRILEAEVL